MRQFCLLLALLVFSQSAGAEPKAYELVKYRGKAEGMTIAFDFGAGYPEASEVRIKQGRAGKSIRFVLDDAEKMRFVPEKNRTGGDAVIINMSSDDYAPNKVTGEYRVGGKTIRFTLTQLDD